MTEDLSLGVVVCWGPSWILAPIVQSSWQDKVVLQFTISLFFVILSLSHKMTAPLPAPYPEYRQEEPKLSREEIAPQWRYYDDFSEILSRLLPVALWLELCDLSTPYCREVWEMQFGVWGCCPKRSLKQKREHGCIGWVSTDGLFRQS